MSRKLVYRGKKINLSVETIPRPGGESTVREVVVHPGAAVIIPLVDHDRVCLVRNERFAVKETLLELPAGTLDPGEAPKATAKRELEEETGYRARRWRKLAEFYPSPGILTELMHLYLAEDLTPGTQHLDAGEKLQPVVLAWSEAIRLALNGSIKDGKTLVGLLLWDRMRQAGVRNGS